MLPVGKNCILDLHFLCHRAEYETKAREIRIYAAAQLHVSIGNLFCLGEMKTAFSKVIFRLLSIFCFNPVEDCGHRYMDNCEEAEKHQCLKYQIRLQYLIRSVTPRKLPIK